MMLRDAVSATGISPETAANLLGINPSIFQEWIAEQRPVPDSFASMLSTVIGIDLETLRKRTSSDEIAEVTPAIWYRFRQDLLEDDREYVFLIRRLGYYMNQLEILTDTRLSGWKSVFQSIRDTIDKQAPPRVQGRQAAKMFREMRGLSVGATGIGEVMRDNLRQMGILVVETPIPKSSLEGCCFFVGSQDSYRPCVFANSHHSTWFRRNFVLMHEVAHAIFDAESAGATLDFVTEDEQSNERDISEERADAFALEALLPANAVKAIAQRNGIKWGELSPVDLAQLVAATHVEKRAVVEAAVVAGLVSKAAASSLTDFDISNLLKDYSDHALSTQEYIEKHGRENIDWMGNRDTVVPSKKLRLPVAYINAILGVYESGAISLGKAAEMLMIDEDSFVERFGAPEEDEEFAA